MEDVLVSRNLAVARGTQEATTTPKGVATPSARRRNGLWFTRVRQTGHGRFFGRFTIATCPKRRILRRFWYPLKEAGGRAGDVEHVNPEWRHAVAGLCKHSRRSFASMLNSTFVRYMLVISPWRAPSPLSASF